MNSKHAFLSDEAQSLTAALQREAERRGIERRVLDVSHVALFVQEHEGHGRYRIEVCYTPRRRAVSMQVRCTGEVHEEVFTSSTAGREFVLVDESAYLIIYRERRAER